MNILKKLLSIIDLNKDGKIQWWEAFLFIIGGIAAYFGVEYFF